jgi:hypothetical protein
MYGDYEKRMKKKGKKNEAQVDDNSSVNQGTRGDPLGPPYFTQVLDLLPLSILIILIILAIKIILRNHY